MLGMYIHISIYICLYVSIVPIYLIACMYAQSIYTTDTTNKYHWFRYVYINYYMPIRRVLPWPFCETHRSEVMTNMKARGCGTAFSCVRDFLCASLAILKKRTVGEIAFLIFRHNMHTTQNIHITGIHIIYKKYLYMYIYNLFIYYVVSTARLYCSRASQFSSLFSRISFNYCENAKIFERARFQMCTKNMLINTEFNSTAR